MSSRVRTIPLVFRHFLQSDGTQNLTYHNLDAPDASDYGPMLEEIVAHTVTENADSNVQWQLVLYWSNDGINWEGPEPVFGLINADGQVNQPPFNDRSKFGLKMRFALAIKNETAGSDKRGAEVSCALSMKYVG